MHPVLGNNVQLANRLGIEVTGGLEPGDKQSVGLYGYLVKPVTAAQFREQLHSLLGRVPLHIGNDNRLIKSIGWCTGAAQGYIDRAVALGLDAYLTGEVSESTVHCAREMGIEFFSAGHHATERYGVQALGERLAATLGIEHQYIEVNNPV
jgi:putative NIF3 family GTP cyclohydrolase 1 type 2